MFMDRNRIDILGVKIDAVTLPQALRAIDELTRDGHNHYIVTPNPEIVMYAQTHSEFRDALNRADLSLADGIGLVWAAKYLSLPTTHVGWLKPVQEWWQWLWTSAAVVLMPKALNIIPERITGADMVWEIAKLASERNQSIFLLGGQPGVAQQAGSLMQQMYPRLVIAGATSGPPYDDMDEIIQHLQQLQPHYIFLALPADQQMAWMTHQLPKLQSTVAMGVGGALDFIAHATALNAPTVHSPARRAPSWMQNRGLEWLWRLVTQPWRRSRIKTATLDFIRAVRKYKGTFVL
jgi:N-acetylglucosaminyldiphosphoundecaprenol N-acetyl-beta-D-mannosaminyltransferase